jgi:Predicted integral membrane protein
MEKRAKAFFTKIYNSKFWKKEGFWHYTIIFICALLFCGLYLFIGAQGYFVGGDDALFHISRYFSVLRGWLDGQVVPQIDPTFLSGFGHSWNIFYGPLPAYAATVVFRGLLNWQLSIALVILMAIFLTGVFAYRFMKDIFYAMKRGNVAALIGAIVYIWSPYLIIDLYGRAAIGEVFAFIFMPVVFHGLWKLVNSKKNGIGLLVVGMVGLILSHSLSAVVALIFGSLFLLLNIKKIIPIWKKFIKNILLAIVIALGLTAFFVLPFIENMSLGIYAINNDWFAENIMYFNSESINNNRLAIGNSWLGTRDFSFYFIVIMAVGSATTAIFLNKKDEKKVEIKKYLLLLIPALILTTTLIDWRFIPDLFYTVQFPTRFLGIASLLVAIIAGYGIIWLVERIKNKNLRGAISILFILLVTISGLIRIPWDVDKNINADNLSTTTNTGLNEYYTMGFLKDGFSSQLADSGKKYTIYGDATVSDFEFDPNSSKRKFHVSSNNESAVELSQIYYSGFQAIDENGSMLEITYSDNGLVKIIIPAGFSGNVVSGFSNSAVTNIGLAVGILTLFIVVAFSTTKRTRLKK